MTQPPTAQSGPSDRAIAAAFRELDTCGQHSAEECAAYNKLFNRAREIEPSPGILGQGSYGGLAFPHDAIFPAQKTEAPPIELCEIHGAQYVRGCAYCAGDLDTLEASPPAGARDAVPFTDASVDTIQARMADLGFVVPVRVISEGLHTALTGKADGGDAVALAREERSHGLTIDQRDRYHDKADALANAISDYFGADIGEHTSANCPWDEALEVIENAKPYQATQPAAPGAGEPCHCAQCDPPTFGTPSYRMVLCGTCGNKRCPHATDHRYACTGSNEPGQFGSSYGGTNAAATGAGEPDGMCYCQEGVVCPTCEQATNTAATGMGDGGRITHFLRKFGLKGLENLSGWPTSYGESCDTERMIENGNLLRDFDEWIGYDALAAQPAPGAVEYDRELVVSQHLLKWNRALPNPIMRIGYEYVVAAECLRLIADKTNTAVTGMGDAIASLAEVMPPKPLPNDDYGFQLSPQHVIALHDRFDKLKAALAAQPAPVVGGDDVIRKLRCLGPLLQQLNAQEAAKTVADTIKLLSARPGGDDRRVFIEGYMEAAHRHAHGSTPISAIEHHARLAADKAGYLAHPAQAGGEDR